MSTASQFAVVPAPARTPAVRPTAGHETESSRDRALLALLFVSLAFVVLFWRLGSPAFWDPDEAHYAETTREMLRSGDWWAPYYNEQTFFDKPALFHQAQGLAMAVFGPTEFAARLIPALAALGLIVVTYWFARTVVSRDTGVVSALLLTASPGVFGLVRYAILDTLFTMFLFGGASLLAVAALHERPRLQWPGYVAIAFALMVKGPLAMVLCGLTFGAALLISADLRRRLLSLHWVVGIAIVLVVASPWFVLMYVRFGDAFVQGYVLDENLRLYASSRFANQPNFYFYFRILAAGLLPWTGLLLGRLFDDVRAVVTGERLDSVELLLWAWSAAIVLFFTFSTFKLDHYVFPACPALCILCARAWSDVRLDRVSSRHAGARLGLQLVGPLMVAIGLGCGYLLVARLELSRWAIVIPAALTLAGAYLTIVANLRGRPPREPRVVLTALLVTYAGLIAFVMPALDRRKVIVELARVAASKSTDPVSRIASYRLPHSAFRFYVDRHVSYLEGAAEARAFFDEPTPFLCLMRRAAYDEFVGQGVPLRIVYEGEGLSATSGRVLWRDRLPLSRFVLATLDR